MIYKALKLAPLGQFFVLLKPREVKYMEYRAVGNRLSINLTELQLPISNREIINLLFKKGFKILEVDLASLARQCIEVSKYRRGARLREAPAVVDCSSFTKWLYGQKGVWLPRRSIQQRKFGLVVEVDEIVAGDLVFVSGHINYYDYDPKDGVGHVGIATDEGTVVHAANSKLNIVESSLEEFIDKDKFRGANRYIPEDGEIFTLETPVDREIETSDDIRWIILQSLSH